MYDIARFTRSSNNKVTYAHIKIRSKLTDKSKASLHFLCCYSIRIWLFDSCSKPCYGPGDRWYCQGGEEAGVHGSARSPRRRSRPRNLTSNYLSHVLSQKEQVLQYFEVKWRNLADHCFLFGTNIFQISCFRYCCFWSLLLIKADDCLCSSCELYRRP